MSTGRDAAAAKFGRADSGPMSALGADESLHAKARPAVSADAQTGRRAAVVRCSTPSVVFPMFPREYRSATRPAWRCTPVRAVAPLALRPRLSPSVPLSRAHEETAIVPFGLEL